MLLSGILFQLNEFVLTVSSDCRTKANYGCPVNILSCHSLILSAVSVGLDHSTIVYEAVGC